jgi:hypothetical protein
MFIPEKAQVYWPLARRSFTPTELQAAVDNYCRYNCKPLRLAEVDSNRLAQNELLRDFWAKKAFRCLI